MNLKNITSVIFLLLIVGCNNENEVVEGYFQVIDKEYNYNDTGLLKIEGDTVTRYQIEELVLDSTTYVWNKIEKKYRTTRRPNGGFYPFKSFNSKYETIGEDTVRFIFDTTGYDKFKKIGKDPSSEEIMKNIEIKLVLKKGIGYFGDTLRKISKSKFRTELREQRKKDSIDFYEPYISIEEAKMNVEKYVEFYLEDELVENSIRIRQQRDDLFHVRFKLKSPYFGTQTYLYSFDFQKDDTFKVNPL